MNVRSLLYIGNSPLAGIEKNNNNNIFSTFLDPRYKYIFFEGYAKSYGRISKNV